MKKFLSLVLALAMTMSLVTISAGAKDFTDADDITYVEAVEVMTAIGVVDGDTAGNFNPTAGLTRGAAAKIICNMILGPTTASALNADADPYKDVNKNSTFAGYIAFCAKEGIISGYADGTFKPAAPLTGYAFMKMLLGALGYDKSVEGYEGANWSINVAKRALNIGLDDGLVDDFNGSDYVTREEAMLYAFNTLLATMVEYDTTITIGDVTVAGSKSAEVEYKNGKYDGNIADDDLLQFAEKYFTKLKGNQVRDDFGRPATEWKNGTDKIGTYVWDADLTYTAEVELGDIYKDLGLSKSVSTDEYATDGKYATDITLSKGNDAKIGANGVLTEVWFNDETDYLVVTHINTYVAKINKVVAATAKADRYVTLSVYTNVPGTLNNKFETESFASEDLVSYTAAYNDKTNKYDVVSVDALTEYTTGTLTEWVGSTHTSGAGKSENTFTLDNTDTYKYSNKKVIVDENGTEQSIADFEIAKAELNVYIDEYGYALFIDGVKAVKNYAMVLGIGSTNLYGSTTRGVTLLLPDGTQKTVNADLPKTLAWTDTHFNGAGTPFALDVNNAIANLVTYTVDEDTGVYTLKTAIKSVGFTDAEKATAKTNFVNGKSLFMIKDTKYYTTDETVFFVATKDGADWVFDVYTGYENMPSLFVDTSTSKVEIQQVAYKADNTYTNQLNFVYVAAEKVAGVSDVDIYFVKEANEDIYTSDTGVSYYKLPAIVDGVETTVKVAVDANASIDNNASEYGLYAVNNVLKNSKDIITSFDDVTNTVFEASTSTANLTSGTVGTVAASKTVVGIGANGDKTEATYWAYNKDTNVYVVDKDYKTITVSSVGAIANDANDLVYADYNDNTKVLTDVVIVEKEAGVAQHTVSFTGCYGIAYVSNVDGTNWTSYTKDVDEGSSLSFKFDVVDAGKVVKSVKIGSTVLAPNASGVYTVENVTEDTTIDVTFANVYTLTIKSSDTVKAAVTFDGETTIVDNTAVLAIKAGAGETFNITVVPESGKTVSNVTADGNFVSGGTNGVYTITANATGAVVIAMS